MTIVFLYFGFSTGDNSWFIPAGIFYIGGVIQFKTMYAKDITIHKRSDE